VAKRDKKATAAFVPPAAKRVPPRAGQLPPPPTDTLIVRFNEFDVDGPWCLTKAPGSEIRDLLAKIASWETMRLMEVFTGGTPGKDYDLPALPNKVARDRLRELGKDDQDRIARLALDGPGRLYGFRRGSHFHALWFDTRHEIWPSKKR